MDMKRIFQRTVQDTTSTASRPASGSQNDHVLYGGGRRLKHRFEYGPNSKSALVELHPSFLPTPEEFKAIVEDVPGVTKVDWQTSKTSQHNVGNHYSEKNLLVYSSTGPGSASPPIEFELTRNRYLKDKRAKETVTAMFKDPPEGLIGEAWRLLLAATKDKLLLPERAQQYRKRHVAQWEGEEPVSDNDPEAPATGPPPSKRDKHGTWRPVGEPRGSAALAPGLPPGPSAAGANAAPSPPPPGDAGARPSSASQPAEAEATSASPLAAPAVLAPGLPPGPSAAGANAAPSPPSHGDAGARPSSASQPAEAEAAGMSDLLSTPPGDEPDWEVGDAVNEAAFVGTPDLRADLEQEVGPATAGALLGGIEQQQVREALLPTFLLPVRERPETNQALAQMQRMKEAAPEHVRWCSFHVDAADPSVAAVAGAMRASARLWLWEQSDPVRDLGILRGTGAPGSASLAQADFLVKANKRSLGVLQLRNDAALRNEYRILLQVPPAITLPKVGEAQLATPERKAVVVGQLVDKHSGEIVELDRRRASWTLERVAPDSASADHSEQWYCCERRARAGRADLDFGWPGTSQEFRMQADLAVRQARSEGCGTPSRDLRPNWAEQVSRVTCPCVDPACGYEWARGGTVLTLGELFLALGKQYTAAQIYSFYRTLRLVAVKRRKGHGAHARVSGSATGVTQSDFQAARVRLEHTPNKEQLLAEYAAANELGHLDATKENVDAAIRYLYKLLLRDLRPPWLTHTFPQALPGNGVLSKFTRPSFLQWDGAAGSKLFGEAVAKLLADVAAAVDLELQGFLARPLYVCTSTSGSDRLMCMSVASMSQLITHVDGRLHYRCGNCMKKDAEQPASGNFPLRVLHLYALVGAGGQDLTPLHSKPVRLVVAAPLAKWAWGRELRDDDHPRFDSGGACPERAKDSRGEHWRYNSTESDAIWCHAGPYRGELSE